VVQKGECLSVIAHRYGLTWPVLWNYQGNADLKKRRKNPDILYPGDKIAIPDPEPRTVTLATGQVHKIVVKRTKVRLRIHLQLNGTPLAGQAFRLRVGDDLTEGQTDPAGLLDVPVPIHAQNATLEIPGLLRRQLRLGGLDPADTISGAQARLQNLGAVSLEVNGELDDTTRQVLSDFQTMRQLAATGDLDQATVAALEEAYGC
jgi:N-acetylmuramoyl-L-alanine amidase